MIYRIGFAGEWIAREYLARRGGVVREETAGTWRKMSAVWLFAGRNENRWADDPSEVPATGTAVASKLGEEGYDKGAKIITDFFKEELEQYTTCRSWTRWEERSIELCMNDAPLEAYLELTPIKRVTGR